MRPAGEPGLLADQLDGQLALGAELDRRAGHPGAGRQLGRAEVEPPGDGQVPGGLAGILQQCPQRDPVVGPHGGGPVGATRRVLVKGAGAPDVGIAAMDLGVVDGPDAETVPGTTGGLFDQTGEAASDGVGAPGAVLGERLQSLPVGRSVEGQDRLGDGVLLDVEGHGGDPLGEAAEAAAGEGPGEATEEVLPDRPKRRSVRHGVSPVRGQMGSSTWQVPSRRRRFQYDIFVRIVWSYSGKLLFSKGANQQRTA